MSQVYLYEAVELCVRKAREAIVSMSTGKTQQQMLHAIAHLTNAQPLPNVIQLKRTIASEIIDKSSYCF